MSRKELIDQMVNIIAAIKRTHPVRVAIDGVDAAGKTTLANELVDPLEKLGRDVIRVSIDEFHNPRTIRYQRGKDSPEGYFFDSYAYDALKESLLIPLGPDGSLQYRTSIFDFHTDSIVYSPKHHAGPNAILIFDGVFLLRSELVNYWDFSAFLDVAFDVAVERASQRDQFLFGSAQDVKERYWKRYIPGQKLYLKTCRPERHADIIIDNKDPLKPCIIRSFRPE